MSEAYQPLAIKGYLDGIAHHSHLLLVRTLSKFGRDGIRLGYMLGHKDLIAEIDKVRPPYNVSVLNCECALFALEHREVFAAQARELVAVREKLLAALAGLPGVTPLKSFHLNHFDACEHEEGVDVGVCLIQYSRTRQANGCI